MVKPQRLPPPKIPTKQSQQAPPQVAQSTPPQISEAEAIERIEAARRELQTLIIEYKDLLQTSQLASNRSTEDNRLRQQLLFKLNDVAGKLEFLNVGEGLMTLAISALHSSLILKDEVNDLKFQNAVLNKRLKALSEKFNDDK